MTAMTFAFTMARGNNLTQIATHIDGIASQTKRVCIVDTFVQQWLGSGGGSGIDYHVNFSCDGTSSSPKLSSSETHTNFELVSVITKDMLTHKYELVGVQHPSKDSSTLTFISR